jgi:hypothetical protein
VLVGCFGGARWDLEFFVGAVELLTQGVHVDQRA